MSAQSMLEQLLRQGIGLLQGQTPGQLPGPARDPAPTVRHPPPPAHTGAGWPGAYPAGQPASGQTSRPASQREGTDWGTFGAGAATGAAATGALGLLLGNKQARRYAGKAAKYGGIAAIGLMAYKAYSHWQSQQPAGQAGQAPSAPLPNATGSAQAHAPHPPALPAPRTADRLAPAGAGLGAEMEDHSRAMLTAMIAAAKADGHLDPRERGLLDDELGRLAADHALRAWVDGELRRPLDPAEVARAARTPEIAAEMYLASLLVADEQSFMERAYLDELARQLQLPEPLKAGLEAQARGA